MLLCSFQNAHHTLEFLGPLLPHHHVQFGEDKFYRPCSYDSVFSLRNSKSLTLNRLLLSHTSYILLEKTRTRRVWFCTVIKSFSCDTMEAVPSSLLALKTLRDREHEHQCHGSDLRSESGALLSYELFSALCF